MPWSSKKLQENLTMKRKYMTVSSQKTGIKINCTITKYTHIFYKVQITLDQFLHDVDNLLATNA